MSVSPDWDREVDVDLVIDAALARFRDEFEELWSLRSETAPEDIDFEEWVELLGLREVATRLVDAALAVERPAGLARRDINRPAQLAYASEQERERVEELLAGLRRLKTPEQDWDAIEHFVRNHVEQPDRRKEAFLDILLQLEVAERLIPSLAMVSGRLRKLLPHLGENLPGDVRTYLERLARCYVMGMDVELALVARAVLEAVLASRRPPEYMRKVKGLDPRAFVYIRDWLEEAESEGLLTPAGLQAAKRIQRSGNQVAHRGLEKSPIDGDALMADMGLVLRELLGPGV